MEASSVTAPASGKSLGAAIGSFLGRWGLIIVLVLLPLRYGIQDLKDDGNLTHLATNVKDGLSNGAIWALVALGYTLVYGIIELINFAHGDVFMIGSFVAVGLYGTFGLTESTGAAGLFIGLLGCLVIAAIACAFLNMLIERVAYRPLRGAPKLAPLITAVGFSFILENVGLLWNGGQQESVPDLIKSQKHLFTIFGVPVTHGDILALVVTVPLFFVLLNYIAQSRLGKAMRATAQDPEASRLMGINV